MKPLSFIAIIAVAFVSVLPIPALASDSGFTTGNVNMRAGPGTRYPKVIVLGTGSDVVIHGCVKNYSWCDVSAHNRRGWVSGGYLEIVYSNQRVHVPRYARSAGVPLITFEVNSYWDDYYEDYGFYDEIDVWEDYEWEAEAYPDEWEDIWIEDNGSDLYITDEDGNSMVIDDSGDAACYDADLDLLFEC